MIRTIERTIARNKMVDAGYNHVNSKMKLKDEETGVALWRRILFGDLADKVDIRSKRAATSRMLRNKEKTKWWKTYGR